MNRQLVLTAEKLLLNKAGLETTGPQVPVSVTHCLYPEILTTNIQQIEALMQSPRFEGALNAVLFVLLADQHFTRSDVPLYSRSCLPDFTHRFQISHTDAQAISLFGKSEEEEASDRFYEMAFLHASLLPDKVNHYMQREASLNEFMQIVLYILTLDQAILTSPNKNQQLRQDAETASQRLVNSMLQKALKAKT